MSAGRDLNESPLERFATPGRRTGPVDGCRCRKPREVPS